jgi:O-antigen ligase/tetratricopeptide (TPR) repeat protein
MARRVVDLESLETSPGKWGLALGGLLVALLVFMPAAFGAVEAWSELVVIAAAALLSLGLLLRVVCERTFRLPRTWALAPLGLALALGALQLIPLPRGVLGTLAAPNLELREELTSVAAPEGSLAADNAPATISLYPHATAHDLRLAMVFVALFLAAASLPRGTRDVKWLLGVVFVIGCAQAGLALLQIVTLSTKIYWTYPAGTQRVVTAGSFVNYSHFSQFMNLSLGAGLALLLVRLHEEGRREFASHRPLADIGWERHARVLAGLALCGLAVLFSMSRNGALSLFTASAVVGWLIYRRGSLSARGWLLGMVPWAVLGVLFLAGFDLVYERLATLSDEQHFDSRWELTMGVLNAWQQFPVWGTGLGTHAMVFPMFDTAVSPVLANHADNDWAQLLEEFGTVGAATVVMFLGMIAWQAWRLIRHGTTPLSTATLGLCLGWMATAIHALSDFGQHLPAVFGLTAVTSGLLVAIARYERRAANISSPDQSGRSIAPSTRKLLAGAALVAGAGAWWWALAGAYAAHLGEGYWSAALVFESKIRDAPPESPPTDDDYVNLIAATEQAAQADPQNARYPYWLNRYRWEAMSRVRDPETGNILLPQEALPAVQRIADELAAVRQLAPTYGPPAALEGDLRLQVLGDPRGADLVQQGYRLAPYHPATCLAAGRLLAEQGQAAAARPVLERAVALSGGYFPDVVAVYADVLEEPAWAEALAGENAGWLGYLAERWEADDRYRDRAAALRERAQTVTRARAEREGASAGEIAAVAALDARNGELREAVAGYRRALALEYGRIDWRIRLADVLVQLEEYPEAVREARTCLRLRAKLPRAEAIVREYGHLE